MLTEWHEALFHEDPSSQTLVVGRAQSDDPGIFLWLSGPEMVDASQVIRELLEATSTDSDQARPDWSWVQNQPGIIELGGIESASTALGDRVMAWIMDYTRRWYPPVDPRDSAEEVQARAERLDRQIRKVWNVLRHHWYSSLDFFAEDPQHWLEIAEIVLNGEGFKRRGKKSPPTTTDMQEDNGEDEDNLDDGSEDDDRADEKFGRLGGNPIRDILLVDAMLDNSTAAYMDFLAEYRPLAIISFRKIWHVPPDDQWWDDFASHLLVQHSDQDRTKPSKLGTYAGLSGLRPWLATALIRRAMRFRKTDLFEGPALDDLPEPDRTGWSAHRLEPASDLVVEFRDCRNKLVQLVVEALHNTESACVGAPGDKPRRTKLKPAEKLVLWMIHVDRLMQNAIAALIETPEHKVTRRKQAGLRRLRTYIQFRLRQEDRFAFGCRDCLDSLGGKLPLEKLLDIAVSETFELIMIDGVREVVARDQRPVATAGEGKSKSSKGGRS